MRDAGWLHGAVEGEDCASRCSNTPRSDLTLRVCACLCSCSLFFVFCVRWPPPCACCSVGDVEAMNAFGSLIDRRDFRTLGLIRSDEEARAALTLQPADAAPFFRHWTLLSPEALAEATGDEGGDLDPEGTLQPRASGRRNGEEQWPDQWLALLHPALCLQQPDPAVAASNGSASQSAPGDSAATAAAAAAIRAHAAAVRSPQLQLSPLVPPCADAESCPRVCESVDLPGPVSCRGAAA